MNCKKIFLAIVFLLGFFAEIICLMYAFHYFLIGIAVLFVICVLITAIRDLVEIKKKCESIDVGDNRERKNEM